MHILILAPLDTMQLYDYNFIAKAKDKEVKGLKKDWNLVQASLHTNKEGA